jgi:phosphoribosylamine---glycine ligase
MSSSTATTSQQHRQQRLLVLGSGGREHALCWKLAQSDRIEAIFCAPGNAGTAMTPKTSNIAITVLDTDEIIEFCRLNHIDCVVIGPENPLAEGLVDQLEDVGIRAFGPKKAAAQLEASKTIAKQFMARYNLPTADFGVFQTYQDALVFCQQNDWARVVKADGLALGKGVTVCKTLDECEQALRDIFTENKFGAAGGRVVIEAPFTGPECSLLLFCDGQTLAPCQLSQDHKRRFDNDTGPNTGGMGTFSPVAWADNYWECVQKDIIKPLEDALREHGKQPDGFVYKGMLFVGLMFDEAMRPHILEFNCRFGDPETQSLLPLLDSDLADIIDACIDGTLHQHPPKWSPQHTTCVVLCAENYPESGSQGEPIQTPNNTDDAIIFHAGSVIGEEGIPVTRGGRVLNVVGLGKTSEDAHRNAYHAVKQCHFLGLSYRCDIGAEKAPVTPARAIR